MKKVMLLALIVSCLNLLGCSQNPPVIVYKEKIVLTPDSLLVHPCEATGAGDTVRSLARGYVKNTTCIGEYKLLLDKIIKHKSQVGKIYKDGNRK